MYHHVPVNARRDAEDNDDEASNLEVIPDWVLEAGSFICV